VPKVDPAAVITTPHPVYDFGAPGRPRKSQPEARKALGLPLGVRLVLYFGFIKPYKGVIHLIEAAPQLKAEYGDGIHIQVVGDIYGEAEPYFDRVTQLGVGDVLEIVHGFVPDETVEDYFLAADLVVLPYVSATQSGIVQIAYNYDKPVVTTNVGGLPEVVVDGETGFLVPPGDPQALADAVSRFFNEDRAEAFAAGVAREKAKYSWDRMAEAVEKLARR
jgi:glycosyltransferase involved in cell wall biosynthesis